MVHGPVRAMPLTTGLKYKQENKIYLSQHP